MILPSKPNGQISGTHCEDPPEVSVGQSPASCFTLPCMKVVVWVGACLILEEGRLSSPGNNRPMWSGYWLRGKSTSKHFKLLHLCKHICHPLSIWSGCPVPRVNRGGYCSSALKQSIAEALLVTLSGLKFIFFKVSVSVSSYFNHHFAIHFPSFEL